ncbi:MAG: hypothetical protein IJV36_05145 [Prevotella sp.]|nr:hypothetical protein [Prevotella sp.]
MTNEESIIQHHKRTERLNPNRKNSRLRNVLNLIFMVGAVIGVLVYFLSNETIGTYIILVAIGFKLVECSIRLVL